MMMKINGKGTLKKGKEEKEAKTDRKTQRKMPQ
jgi:hypothetical protein